MSVEALPQTRSFSLTNTALVFITASLCCACLWLASQPIAPIARLAAAVAFGFLNNTMFSLTHEAVHGMLHQNCTVNEALARVTCAFFPTSFTLQRNSHLTHHRNNRSDIERFDFYATGDNHVLKTAQWYSILTGLYWVMIPVFAIIYSLLAEIVPWRKLIIRSDRFGAQTSALPYLDALQAIPIWRIRLDMVIVIIIQSVIIWALGINLTGWLLCYACFALFWSSLQYADHAFSRLDREEGAWNLRVSPLVRALFLNYHFHLCHHRQTSIRWHQLPSAEQRDDPQVDYWRILYLMWAGPRSLPGEKIAPQTQARNDLTVNLFLSGIFTAIFALIYWTGDQLYKSAPNTADLSLAADALFPFIPQAALIYLTISPLLLIAPFLMKTPDRLLPLAVTLVFELLVALAIFYVMPVLPPVLASSQSTGWLMWLADTVNLDGNNFPSLHVALSVSAVIAYLPLVKSPWKTGFVIWAVLIVLSTLLTRQHGLADVAGGLVLAFGAMAFVYPRAIKTLATIKQELLDPNSAVQGSAVRQ